METIELKINQILVKGEITNRTERDLAVIITEPYQNISNGTHRPHWSNPNESFLSSTGIEKAKILLKEIYELCLAIEEGKDLLKKALPEYDKELNNCNEAINQLNTTKSELKSKLKNNQLTNVEFQKAVAPIGKEIEERKNTISDLFQKYFQPHIHVMVTFGTDKEVIEYIRKM